MNRSSRVLLSSTMAMYSSFSAVSSFWTMSGKKLVMALRGGAELVANVGNESRFELFGVFRFATGFG